MALQWLSKGKHDEGVWQIPQARVRRAAATSMRRKEMAAASKNNTAATKALRMIKLMWCYSLLKFYNGRFQKENGRVYFE